VSAGLQGSVSGLNARACCSVSSHQNIGWLLSSCHSSQ
jgi:hypothetical protein